MNIEIQNNFYVTLSQILIDLSLLGSKYRKLFGWLLIILKEEATSHFNKLVLCYHQISIP